MTPYKAGTAGNQVFWHSTPHSELPKARSVYPPIRAIR